MSAYGLALADVVEEVQEPCSLQYEQHSFSEIDQRVEQLSKRCRDKLCGRGFTRSAVRATPKGNLSKAQLQRRGDVGHDFG